MLFLHSTLTKGVFLAGFGLKTLVGAAPTLEKRVSPGSSEIPIPALSAHEHEWYCKTDTRPLMGIDHQLSCGPAYRAYPSKTGKPLCSGIFSGPSYIACNTCVRVTCGNKSTFIRYIDKAGSDRFDISYTNFLEIAEIGDYEKSDQNLRNGAGTNVLHHCTYSIAETDDLCDAMPAGGEPAPVLPTSANSAATTAVVPDPSTLV